MFTFELLLIILSEAFTQKVLVVTRDLLKQVDKDFNAFMGDHFIAHQFTIQGEEDVEEAPDESAVSLVGRPFAILNNNELGLEVFQIKLGFVVGYVIVGHEKDAHLLEPLDEEKHELDE